ncbi:MAG: TetR/AcrR family transcriptional regulator [Propionibacteriaceae bacterium]|nr:TetR/AcrR family transcriptional regulator [Propionibacteriaceae bacterium]
MPKVSEAHRGARRDQILDAAVTCFLRRGVRATTMVEIIAESGLSAGAIYVYYDSKQTLALAAVRREAAGLAAALDSASTTSAMPPSQVLRLIADSLADRLSTPALIIQMWGEATSDPQFEQIAIGAFTELGTMFAVQLERWAREACSLDADAAAEWSAQIQPVMLGLLQGLMLQQTLVPNFDRDRYLAGIDELFQPPATPPLQNPGNGA